MSSSDRIQATRLASRCVAFLVDQAQQAEPAVASIGLQGGRVHIRPIEDFPRLVDCTLQRPKDQWWLDLRSGVEPA